MTTQIDSELGEYTLSEIDSMNFIWMFRYEINEDQTTNLRKILNWWNDSGFGKNNWMLLRNFDNDFSEPFSFQYYIFDVTFTDEIDAAAFKLRWI